MKKIKVGFIGAGDISVLHAQALHQIPEVQLVGLWNITDDLATEKCAMFGCKKFASAEDLVNEPNLDAIFVLTALEAHYKYVMLALEAGKHVFVEKPVGVNIDELKNMQQASVYNQRILMPGHNYIYEPSVIRAKDLIISGKLGELVSIYVLYNIHHPEEVAARYPGVIRQILTHHAYITTYLAGPPSAVTAMKSVIHYKEITQEDIAMVTMKMKNGALVHLCASYAADDHAGDPWTMMIKVIGTKGATRYSYRDWVENMPAQVHSQTYSAYPYTIKNIDEFFINECLAKNREPLSTIEDAITAQKIIEAIEASVKDGRHTQIGD